MEYHFSLLMDDSEGAFFCQDVGENGFYNLSSGHQKSSINYSDGTL